MKLQQAVLPAGGVGLGLLLGAALIIVGGDNPIVAYSAMAEGALSDLDKFGRTLEKATPLVFGGLAVAFAFKAGLFNIGGQGQLLLGAAFGAWIGFRFSLPAPLHVLAAILVGGFVAALLGGLAGLLKATRGTHEVISTIMLNFVAANLTDWLVSRDGPWNDASGGALARTPLIQDSAALPRIAGLPTGFLVAVLAAILMWWVVARSTLGFEVMTVGANPKAAKYAGINVTRITVLAMGISAFLAGTGGVVQTLGVNDRFEPGFNSGLGFDGITIALLARTNALAVVPAALLIGAMDAGSSLMQARTDVAPEIINVIQAFILFFVAAPSVVRWIVGQRGDSAIEDTVPGLSTKWGAT